MNHTKGNTSEYIYKIIIICSSKKHSQGLHWCGRIAGVKIKYEPVQFEGLSDAKIVHSGLLPRFYNNRKISCLFEH